MRKAEAKNRSVPLHAIPAIPSKKYLYKLIEQRLTYAEIDQMSDHDLEQLFCPLELAPREERFEQLQKLFPEVESR